MVAFYSMLLPVFEGLQKILICYPFSSVDNLLLFIRHAWPFITLSPSSGRRPSKGVLAIVLASNLPFERSKTLEGEVSTSRRAGIHHALSSKQLLTSLSLRGFSTARRVGSDFLKGRGSDCSTPLYQIHFDAPT